MARGSRSCLEEEESWIVDDFSGLPLCCAPQGFFACLSASPTKIAQIQQQHDRNVRLERQQREARELNKTVTKIYEGR